ncbi:Replication protein O [Peribacillus frigoritolerans]|uniref:Replication protein O n=1 Tax=Peribacillus frigoritolerans TaxID=450367 RepID=UPI0025A14328|nr:Replication protein O [Peribacillus frigoritolerans]MDM5310348.1 Replication protein O [Peribacillus frigoritolerans]
MPGWIKLHRQIQDHWLYQENRKFSKYEAWLDLLMMVNHEDKKAVIGNEVIEVKRGQRITSVRKLCDKWGWSNTKVKQFLSLLQNDRMIHLKSDSKKTLITINNYDFYQGTEDKKTTQNRHGNDIKKTKKHTNKNDKELKNEKEDINTSCCRSKTYDEESVPFQLSLRLLHNIRKNNEEFKEPDLQKWSNDIRLMMDKDNRSEEQIRYLIDWCQQDSFWKANILSPSKLRKQYDQLVARIKSEKQMKKKSLHDIPTKRPEHWPERKPLTKEELSRIEKLEAEMPF